MAKSIMVQGTGSSVGKSVTVTALCRIFLQDGFRVCPFKAQNMSLNSFVTKDGGEMGRAQVTQAQSCRIEPEVEMNPILIKPTCDTKAQVIVRGKPVKNMNTLEYVKYKGKLSKTVNSSFDRLADKFEIMVIEGAGSPAEINLKRHDLVNMKVAKYAKAPVILVGDIDKGGVFAWIVGTLELLSKQERETVKGIIINKFRGDKTLLKPGIDFLEKRTGVKVLGVIPYFYSAQGVVKGGKQIRIPEEDAVSLDKFIGSKAQSLRKIRINIIYLPHISNFTDFDALEREPDVSLKYIKKPEDLSGSDIIIIPGTKNTISDLRYLNKSGFTEKILSIVNSKSSVILVGICGGYQMLGNKIYDRKNMESSCKEIDGLRLLPIETDLKEDKTLLQVQAKDLISSQEVSGYEIHHGATKVVGNAPAVFEIFQKGSKKMCCFEGARSNDGRILGTYIHGVFDASRFRRDFLNRSRIRNGLPALPPKEEFTLEKEFDKLAKLVRENIDMKLLYKILNDGLKS